MTRRDLYKRAGGLFAAMRVVSAPLAGLLGAVGVLSAAKLTDAKPTAKRSFKPRDFERVAAEHPEFAYEWAMLRKWFDAHPGERSIAWDELQDMPRLDETVPRLPDRNCFILSLTNERGLAKWDLRVRMTDPWVASERVLVWAE